MQSRSFNYQGNRFHAVFESHGLTAISLFDAKRNAYIFAGYCIVKYRSDEEVWRAWEAKLERDQLIADAELDADPAYAMHVI